MSSTKVLIAGMTMLFGASCVQDSPELANELTTEETEQALQLDHWDDGMRSFSSQGTPVPEPRVLPGAGHQRPQLRDLSPAG